MLLTYIEGNFTISPEAGRIMQDICAWAADHYENKDGTLTEEGVHFLEHVLSGIGIERKEIIANWKEEV